jgi:hypothetical protein
VKSGGIQPYAAAGGTGQIAVQLAKLAGHTVGLPLPHSRGVPDCLHGLVTYWLSSIECALTHNNNVSEMCQP